MESGLGKLDQGRLLLDRRLLDSMVLDRSPDQLRPVKSDEFLPPIRPWVWGGGLVLLGSCLGMVILAMIVPYTVTIRAKGTVRPQGDIRLVQAATEGTVRQIAVIENQRVRQGEVIATIDDSRLQTQKGQTGDKIRQGQQQLAEIDRQMQALETQITAELSYLQRTVASAQAELARQQRDYQEHQVTSQTGLQEAAANLKQARDERDRYRTAVAAGVVSEQQYSEKEQAVKIAEARMERARAGLNPTDALVTTASERIAQEQARGEATLANLQREQQTLRQRQLELAGQLQRDQKEWQQIGQDLERQLLRAPIDGTVLHLQLRNPQQVVRPGDTIAQIAPDQTSLVIKAQVAAQDISQIAVGQMAQIRISAYPYPDYGILQGMVQAVAPDAVMGSANPGSGYYEVTIQPTLPYFKPAPGRSRVGDRPALIQPGMEGTVDILSRQETILKFILRKARLLTDM